MNKTISIPPEFADLIASCEQTRFGEQDRPYAPHRWLFFLRLKDFPQEKKVEVERRILDFCQRYCKTCKYSSDEYRKIQSNDALSFHEKMCAVAEGRYTFFWQRRKDGEPAVVEYEVVRDYID